MENVAIAHDGTVRDGAGHVLQFVYGDDGYDGAKVYRDRDRATTLPFMPALLDKWAALPPTDADVPETLPPTVRDWLQSRAAGWVGDKRGLYDEIVNRHQRALAPPGEMVGVLAAQSISEIATQMTLNTFHLAGVNNNLVVGGVPRLKQLCHVSSMRTVCRAPYEPNVERLSGRRVRDVVDATAIAYRDLEAPWEHRFARFFYPELEERAMWITLELNQDVAIHVRDRVVRDLELVALATHTTDDVDAVAVALHAFDLELAQDVLRTVLDLRLGGVDGAVFERDGDEVVVSGGDLGEVLAALPKAVPDNPVACLAHLGIEAARECLLRQLRNVLAFDGSYVNHRHLALLADSMCYAGDLSPFNRHGLARRGGTVIEAASFETATTVLVRGAVANRKSDLKGVSEAILLGRLAPIGTGVAELRLDEAALANALDFAPAEDHAAYSPNTHYSPAATPSYDLSPTIGLWSPEAPALDLYALYPQVLQPPSPMHSPTTATSATAACA